MTVHLLSFASVMKSVGGVVLAVAILLAMVTIHEFGHYVAGKLLNFKINEFSVGFGPAIFKKRSKKTGELFALRVIPLGGYCAFDGEDEFEEEEPSAKEEPFEEIVEEKANEGGMVAMNEESAQESPQENDYPEPKGERFNDQAPWKRIIVLLAGATMNYLLALLFIVVMFAGFGRPLYQVVEPSKPSNLAVRPIEGKDTLQTGDIILEIEGKNVYLITDYIDILNNRKENDEIAFTVLRGEEERVVWLALQQDTDFENMSSVSAMLTAIGVPSMTTTTERQGFFETIGHSFVYSVKIGGTVLRSLGELLTGRLQINAVGGPITTIKVTSEAASSGLMSFLNIAAFIGVNLAVFNLLPIPALDGCKVIFCLIEWIRKKPINRKVETIIHLAGIIFLFGFAILVDILQLF